MSVLVITRSLSLSTFSHPNCTPSPYLFKPLSPSSFEPYSIKSVCACTFIWKCVCRVDEERERVGLSGLQRGRWWTETADTLHLLSFCRPRFLLSSSAVFESGESHLRKRSASRDRKRECGSCVPFQPSLTPSSRLKPSPLLVDKAAASGISLTRSRHLCVCVYEPTRFHTC